VTVAPDADGIRVRHVERADLLAVHRIERAAFPTPWPFEAFERFVEAPGFLVAVEAPEDAVAPSADGGAGERATENAPGDGDAVDAADAIDGADAMGSTGAINGAEADSWDAADAGQKEEGKEAPSNVIDDGGVVGYVVAEVTPNHGRAFGHVKDLAVHPDHRRRGIASTLLERAIVTVAGHGAASVKLEVREDNDPARTLYREFGFSPMRRREGYYEDGEDALVLAREL